MKINKILTTGILGATLTIGLTGCATKFDRFNKGIYFNNENHKPYYVPYNTNEYYVNSQARVNLAKNVGIDRCQIGDVMWVSIEHDKNRMNTLEWLRELKEKGLIGCALPMTDQEFRYLAGKEMQNRQFQHEQNIQNQKSLDKTLDRITPKTHNVNVHVY